MAAAIVGASSCIDSLIDLALAASACSILIAKSIIGAGAS
jgi:hypothetical protein